MHRILSPFLLVLVLLVVPAAADRGVTPERAVAGANNAFAVDLYRKVASKPGNVLLSPWSISSALAMVSEGARGDTREQMRDVLHLPRSVPARGIPAVAKALEPGRVPERTDGGQRMVPAYEISIANRVWVQERLRLVDDYVATLEGAWAAPVGRIDFRRTAAARTAINDWVAERTKNRIEGIVPEQLPTPDTLLALANAIYFRAAWKHPFRESMTGPGTFTRSDGSEVECDFMRRVGGYPYVKTDTLEAVAIPYRDEAAMVLLLPKRGVGIAGIEKDLSWPALNSILGRLSGAQVELRLPKFTFTWAANLEDVLPEMGMESAFSPVRADFTGITTEKPLVVGPVLHKAFVAVDEAGTEASAATVVLVKPGGASPQEPVEFHADRPFLFLIRHADTGTILFLGRVSDPTAD